MYQYTIECISQTKWHVNILPPLHPFLSWWFWENCLRRKYRTIGTGGICVNIQLSTNFIFLLHERLNHAFFWLRRAVAVHQKQCFSILDFITAMNAWNLRVHNCIFLIIYLYVKISIDTWKSSALMLGAQNKRNCWGLLGYCCSPCWFVQCCWQQLNGNKNKQNEYIISSISNETGYKWPAAKGRDRTFKIKANTNSVK